MLSMTMKKAISAYVTTVRGRQNGWCLTGRKWLVMTWGSIPFLSPHGHLCLMTLMTHAFRSLGVGMVSRGGVCSFSITTGAGAHFSILKQPVDIEGHRHTLYVGPLLLLKISCVISTVCFSVTVIIYSLLLFMHMSVVSLSVSIPLLLLYFSLPLLLLNSFPTSLSSFFPSPSVVCCNYNNSK